MGIYMAGRSIVRLVSRRFSTGSKVPPKSDTVVEKFPTKDGRVIDYGLKFICVFSFVMALLRSAEIREAEAKAKALGEKTPDGVAAEKRQEA